MPLFIVFPLISYLLWNWFYQWQFCQPLCFLRFGLGSLHWDFPKVNMSALIRKEVIHTWLAINCEGLQRRKLRTGGSTESIQSHLVIYYHGCAQKWNITIGMESLVIFTHNPQKSPEYVSPSTQNETEFSLRIFCECSFVFFFLILLILGVCWVLIAIH